MSQGIPTSLQLDATIITLNALSLIGALIIIFLSRLLKQQLLTCFGIPLLGSHLCMLVSCAIYSTAMNSAPISVCILRQALLIYSTKSMQYFAVGFSLHVWRALTDKGTTAVGPTKTWGRFDLYVSCIAFLTPIIPMILSSVPQLSTITTSITESAEHCQLGYMAHWQLAFADIVWSAPSILLCLTLVIADIILVIRRYRRKSYRVLTHSLSPSMMIGIFILCLYVSINGITYIVDSLGGFALFTDINAVTDITHESVIHVGISTITGSLTGLIICIPFCFCEQSRYLFGKRSVFGMKHKQPKVPNDISFWEGATRQPCISHLGSVESGPARKKTMDTTDPDQADYCLIGRIRRRSGTMPGSITLPQLENHTGRFLHHADTNVATPNRYGLHELAAPGIFYHTPLPRSFKSFSEESCIDNDRHWLERDRDLSTRSLPASTTALQTQIQETKSYPEVVSSVVPIPRKHARSLSKYSLPPSQAPRRSHTLDRTTYECPVSPLYMPKFQSSLPSSCISPKSTQSMQSIEQMRTTRSIPAITSDDLTIITEHDSQSLPEHRNSYAQQSVVSLISSCSTLDGPEDAQTIEQRRALIRQFMQAANSDLLTTSTQQGAPNTSLPACQRLHVQETLRKLSLAAVGGAHGLTSQTNVASSKTVSPLSTEVNCSQTLDTFSHPAASTQPDSPSIDKNAHT